MTRAALLKDCQDSVTGCKDHLVRPPGVKKTILIEHPKASVQINVQTFKPKVEERKNLFALEAPEAFKSCGYARSSRNDAYQR